MADPAPDLLAALRRSITAAKLDPTPTPLTDAERKNLLNAGDGLLDHNLDVERLLAAREVAARADERERIASGIRSAIEAHRPHGHRQAIAALSGLLNALAQPADTEGA